MLRPLVQHSFFRDPPLADRADRPLVVAHRGASADAPENTLTAFREAVAQGADGIELDVMVCGSGELVVCHDRWLDRLAGRHVDVGSTTLTALRELEVGSHLSPRFEGEVIATLDEVFDVVPEGIWINVELKSDGLSDSAVARLAARVIAADCGRHPVTVSSFNPVSLALFRAFAPEVPTGLLFDSGQALPLREGLAAPLVATCAVHPESALCTRERVARWQQAGYGVVTWTVDEAEEVARLADWGVDALITNRPGEVRERLRRG